MQRITVKLASNPYDVVIGSGGLQNLGQEMLNSGISAPRKVLVVSNADVAGPYGATVLESLRSSGFEADSLVIEAGEDQKHLGTVSQIHDAAHRLRLERGLVTLAEHWPLASRGFEGEQVGVLRMLGEELDRGWDPGPGATHLDLRSAPRGLMRLRL